MEWKTTSTVLQALRDFGDEHAWEQFDARFRRPIVLFGRKVGLTEDEAEDAAQETLVAFAEAFRSGRYDPDKGRLSGWLFGIAYRQAMKKRRARHRHEVVAEAHTEGADLLSSLPAEEEASATWDVEWERAILAQCMDRVSREVEPVTFRAFELAVLEERSAAAAAAELGVAIKVVYNAKHRVLKRIREIRADLEEVR